jgi:hypothetical protein
MGMMGHRPPIGYSPMGVPMAGYHGGPPHPHQGHPRGMYPPPSSSQRPPSSSARKALPPKAPPATPKASGVETPTSASVDATTTPPKTPAVRIEFDPATSRKKRMVTPGEVEPTAVPFGKANPEQPKTTALAIFSFLSNDDLYHAGLVCKKWSRLAMDEELWNFS